MKKRIYKLNQKIQNFYMKPIDKYWNILIIETEKTKLYFEILILDTIRKQLNIEELQKLIGYKINEFFVDNTGIQIKMRFNLNDEEELTLYIRKLNYNKYFKYIGESELLKILL